MHSLADNFLGELQFEVLTGYLGDALSAVNGSAYLRVVFDEHGRQPLTGALQCGVTASWASAHNQNVTVSNPFIHSYR